MKNLKILQKEVEDPPEYEYALLDTRRAKGTGKFPIKIKVSFLNERTYYSTSQNLFEQVSVS
jgi:hypothetical protein